MAVDVLAIPSTRDRARATVALAAPVGLILLEHLNEAWPIGRYAVMACAVVALTASAWARAWAAVAWALLFVLLRAYWLVAPAAVRGLPSISFLIPFVFTVAGMRLLPRARGTFQWLRRGEVDRLSWGLVAASSVAAILALYAWAYWTDNLGVAAKMMRGFGQIPPFVLIPLLVLFAIVNAFAEEVVWRGVAQEALVHGSRSPWLVVPLQAASFALAHFEAGFPNGKLGYAMVFTWALSLGYLRDRTKGILAPWVAHVLADATIAILLYANAR